MADRVREHRARDRVMARRERQPAGEREAEDGPGEGDERAPAVRELADAAVDRGPGRRQIDLRVDAERARDERVRELVREDRHEERRAPQRHAERRRLQGETEQRRRDEEPDVNADRDRTQPERERHHGDVAKARSAPLNRRLIRARRAGLDAGRRR